jgi:8-oxo-dGTP diphosphatase
LIAGIFIVEEEMGIAVKGLQFLYATNDIMTTENKHYVTIFMGARPQNPNALPQNMEPHKCEGWNAMELEELCSLVEQQDNRLFLPLKNFLQERPLSLEQYINNDPESIAR